MLEGITIKNVKTNEEKNIPVAGLFVFIGYDPVADFVPETLNKDELGFILTDTEMSTNLPGIFAAGDIRAKLCRQVVTAAGDGATAAHSAYIYLESLNA